MTRILDLSRSATLWLGGLGRSATLWLGGFIIFSYWLFAPLMPGEQLVEWLRSSQIIVSVIVAIAYMPSIVEILKERMPSQAQQLVLGIVVAWAGAAGNAGWFLLWRLAGKPEWMVGTASINGFFIWMMVVGGFLHLTAPRSIEGTFPRSNWVRIVVVLALSAALAVYMLSSPPDARGLAEWLRPYLG